MDLAPFSEKVKNRWAGEVDSSRVISIPMPLGFYPKTAT